MNKPFITYKEENEQLRDKVRELEEENARLIGRPIPLSTWQKMEQDLAASQAYAEQLREALELLNGASSVGCDLVDKALALPRDTSALDAFVAKRLHDMACDKGLLRIQVEELTRQRDLAVEALEKIAKKCNLDMHGDDGSLGGYAYGIWNTANSTISTIKESEAMAQGEK